MDAGDVVDAEGGLGRGRPPPLLIGCLKGKEGGSEELRRRRDDGALLRVLGGQVGDDGGVGAVRGRAVGRPLPSGHPTLLTARQVALRPLPSHALQHRQGAHARLGAADEEAAPVASSLPLLRRCDGVQGSAAVVSVEPRIQRSRVVEEGEVAEVEGRPQLPSERVDEGLDLLASDVDTRPLPLPVLVLTGAEEAGVCEVGDAEEQQRIHQQREVRRLAGGGAQGKGHEQGAGERLVEVQHQRGDEGGELHLFPVLKVGEPEVAHLTRTHQRHRGRRRRGEGMKSRMEQESDGRGTAID